MERNVTIRIPKHAIPDSHKVFLTAVADPMGVAMNNLPSLLNEQPQGGEYIDFFYKNEIDFD